MNIFKRQKFQWPALWSGCQKNSIQYAFGKMCVLCSAVLVDEASLVWYWYMHIKQFTDYLIWINTHSIKLSLFHYLWIIPTQLIQTDFTPFAWLVTVSCVRRILLSQFISNCVFTCRFHDWKMLRYIFQRYWFFDSFSSYKYFV